MAKVFSKGSEYMKSKLILSKPEGPSTNYIGGVDLGSGKDHTIIINANNPYIDKDKIVAEIMEKLYDPRNPRGSGGY